MAELAHFPLKVINNAKVKAAELEDYQSIAASDGCMEGLDEPAAKRKRMAKEVKHEMFDWSEFLLFVHYNLLTGWK